jgi:hypothetical protein
MMGVSTALFQKIQCQDKWSIYQASSDVDTFVVKTISIAYIAIPSSTNLTGRFRKMKARVSG